MIQMSEHQPCAYLSLIEIVTTTTGHRLYDIIVTFRHFQTALPRLRASLYLGEQERAIPQENGKDTSTERVGNREVAERENCKADLVEL